MITLHFHTGKLAYEVFVIRELLKLLFLLTGPVILFLLFNLYELLVLLPQTAAQLLLTVLLLRSDHLFRDRERKLHGVLREQEKQRLSIQPECTIYFQNGFCDTDNLLIKNHFLSIDEMLIIVLPYQAQR